MTMLGVLSRIDETIGGLGALLVPLDGGMSSADEAIEDFLVQWLRIKCG